MFIGTRKIEYIKNIKKHLILKLMEEKLKELEKAKKQIETAEETKKDKLIEKYEKNILLLEYLSEILQRVDDDEL